MKCAVTQLRCFIFVNISLNLNSFKGVNEYEIINLLYGNYDTNLGLTQYYGSAMDFPRNGS